MIIDIGEFAPNKVGFRQNTIVSMIKTSLATTNARTAII